MKKISLFILVIILVFISVFFLYLKHNTKGNQKNILLSPIPDFLTIFQNYQVTTTNLWLPTLDEKQKSSIEEPELTAKSVLVYDLTDKIVLFEKNPKQKLPMASLTKIMTAIIALENPKKDDKYKVFKECIVGESMMGLDEKEVLTLEELLYGLILRSGNDAAEVLAANYEGGRTAFIKAMNDKAKALGLKDTNFTNPSGLEGDGNQYTTVYDLLIITNYALKNFPTFTKVCSTFTVTLDKNLRHKEYVLENETNLLTTYPGVKGVKIGYTNEAGLCLITYLDYEEHKIIAIILNSENRRSEMKELLDYSLKTLGVEPPKHD